VVHLVVIFFTITVKVDRGVDHVVVVVILSTITVLDLSEEWFMLLVLYCMRLLVMV
jgi:hypothetical protein